MTQNFEPDHESSAKFITQSSGSSFTYSFFFLPKKKRIALTVVYAFCRLADNISDDTTSSTEAREKLDFWYKEIDLCYSGHPRHPVTRQLQEVIREFKIPKDYFFELLRGVEMDFSQYRYKTFGDLYQYCYRVASIVGLICVEIFGYQNPKVKEHAIQQGLAFQLTNILRDVKEDYRLGRIYIPQEDLEKFQYTEKDLEERIVNSNFKALMQFEADRAKDYYRKAQDLIPPQDRPALIASEIMGTIYFRLLKKIEEADYNVFEKKIRLSSFQKLVMALGTWLRLKFSRSK